MSDLFSLVGSVALVTGSTRGLGFAIAEALARHGATVALNSRSGDDVQRARERLVKSGFEALALPFDINKADAAMTAVRELKQTAGRIDILVNNAGIQHRKTLLDWDDTDFEHVIAVNLTSSFRLCREVARIMLAQHSGSIINTGSIVALAARPTIHAYTASKAGLHGLTRSLAAELGPNGIRVNALAPGFFATELNQALVEDPEFTAWIEDRTPLQRWGKIEEIGGAAVFLASDASSYVNGHVLVVDGGMTQTM